jgi:hypothetical protein
LAAHAQLGGQGTQAVWEALCGSTPIITGMRAPPPRPSRREAARARGSGAGWGPDAVEDLLGPGEQPVGADLVAGAAGDRGLEGHGPPQP